MSFLDVATGRLFIDDLRLKIDPTLTRTALQQQFPAVRDCVEDPPRSGFLFRPVHIGGRRFGVVLRFCGEELERIALAELLGGDERELHDRHVRWLQAVVDSEHPPPYSFPWGTVEATLSAGGGAGMYITYQHVTFR